MNFLKKVNKNLTYLPGSETKITLNCDFAAFLKEFDLI